MIPATPNQNPADEQARWFVAEVQPHDSQLRAYLRHTFPGVRDVDDVVQESYLRILKARAGQPFRSARAFLFCVAKRVAIDALRKNRRTESREVVLDFDSASVVVDGANVAETVSIEEEFTLLAEAIHSLPERCRQIMTMRKLQRMSHQDIARDLGLSTATVEVQIGRGMGKCVEFMRKRGVAIRPKAGLR